MDANGLPESLLGALGLVEDFGMAHCIASDATAVLILRDDRGGEFRRLIGPKGSSEIPPEFDDAVVLARLAAKRSATPEDLLALDATIAEAQASGDRVILMDQSDFARRNRIALYGPQCG